MTRLRHLKLWRDQPGMADVNLANIPATQADLDALRTVINGQIDIINHLLDFIEGLDP